MRATQTESELRGFASERIKRHLLPTGTGIQVWAGPGTGELCSLCGMPVGREETEYEIDECECGTVRTFRLHVPCHAVWYAELTALRSTLQIACGSTTSI